MTIIVSVILGILAVGSIGLKRAYESVSAKELKKRARAGDQTAQLLHRSVAYGPSLNLVLWSIVCVLNAAFFVYVSRSSEPWFAAVLCAGLLWLGFVWLPSRQVSSFGLMVAAKISPVVAKIASFLYPLARNAKLFTERFFPVHVHTGMYDKDDLKQLLLKQASQHDNQISDSSLMIAQHALFFGDTLVRDVLIPRRAVKMVHADDTIGPVLINELHASGFSRFPVSSGDDDAITGILYLRELVKKQTKGKISGVMDNEVLYIHEDQTLADALQAILKTHKHLFIVVNSFEEYVGILTIEDVLEKIVGEQIVDEFDNYEDMRAVAALEADKDHKKNTHPAEKL